MWLMTAHLQRHLPSKFNFLQTISQCPKPAPAPPRYDADHDEVRTFLEKYFEVCSIRSAGDARLLAEKLPVWGRILYQCNEDEFISLFGEMEGRDLCLYLQESRYGFVSRSTMTSSFFSKLKCSLVLECLVPSMRPSSFARNFCIQLGYCPRFLRVRSRRTTGSTRDQHLHMCLQCRNHPLLLSWSHRRSKWLQILPRGSYLKDTWQAFRRKKTSTQCLQVRIPLTAKFDFGERI